MMYNLHSFRAFLFEHPLGNMPYILLYWRGIMTERVKILVTQKVPDPAYPLLEAIGDVEANMEEGVIWPYEELLRHGPGHEYIYCLLTDNIDARFLEACVAGTPRLKMVANMAVGFNNIDVDAATRLGIAVSNTPGVLSDTTADLAFDLLRCLPPVTGRGDHLSPDIHADGRRAPASRFCEYSHSLHALYTPLDWRT